MLFRSPLKTESLSLMEFCSGKPDNPAASVMDYCTGVLIHWSVVTYGMRPLEYFAKYDAVGPHTRVEAVAKLDCFY